MVVAYADTCRSESAAGVVYSTGACMQCAAVASGRLPARLQLCSQDETHSTQQESKWDDEEAEDVYPEGYDPKAKERPLTDGQVQADDHDDAAQGAVNRITKRSDASVKRGVVPCRWWLFHGSRASHESPPRQSP